MKNNKFLLRRKEEEWTETEKLIIPLQETLTQNTHTTVLTTVEWEVLEEELQEEDDRASLLINDDSISMIVTQMFNSVIQFIADVEEDKWMTLTELQIDHVIIPFVNCAEYLKNELDL